MLVLKELINFELEILVSINHRHSPSDQNLRGMGHFRIQLLADFTWETNYTLEGNTKYSSSSTKWSLFSLDCTEKNYYNKMMYDRIDTGHAVIFF